MRAKFVRGQENIPSKLGLGLVTIELDYHNFRFDEDTGEPDMSDEDTAYSVEQLEESGLQYEFKESNWGPVLVTLTGSRDKMAPFVAEYLEEPVDMIRDGMYQWDGKDEHDFWKLIGY